MAALVNYDNSSDESSPESEGVIKRNKRSMEEKSTEEKASHNLSKRQRLPVPDAVKSMFSSTDGAATHIDDPDKHCGKIRTFAHERGNWASYVYVKGNDSEKFTDLTSEVIKYLQPFIEFMANEDYHISLSRTFVLRHHWIESLLNTLRGKLKICHRCLIELSGIELYCNDEFTRTFLGIKVRVGSDALVKYVKEIDSSLEEFKLPIYYKNPSFHMSIAWANGDVREKITETVKQGIENIISEFFDMCSKCSVFEVNNLILKTGNKNFVLPLG